MTTVPDGPVDFREFQLAKMTLRDATVEYERAWSTRSDSALARRRYRLALLHLERAQDRLHHLGRR